MQDLRYAVRALRTQPLFSLVAIVTLAVGIGANTAIFSLLYSVLLRPLPFPHSDRLVFVGNVYAAGSGEASSVSIPDYLDRRGGAPALEDAALYTVREATLMVGTTPEQVTSLRVTPSFFTTLGRSPALGRTFQESDAVAGADTAVILTHQAWASRFSADAGIVGRSIRVNGATREVVGVLPADFELPVRDVSLLQPFGFTAAQRSDQERGNEFSEMIGRLREGATIAQLNAQMSAIVARLMTSVPDRAEYMRTSGFGGAAFDLRERLVGQSAASLYLLQAGVALLLLIACANVANLLLMRAAGRRRELALRASLGASSARILRQMLTEGFVLSAAAGAFGLALGAAGTRALVAMMGEQLPRGVDVHLNGPILCVTAMLALSTTVIFGIVPALPAMRGRVSVALKEEGGRSSGSARARRVRGALAVAEVSLALVLLAGAGLFVKSFIRVLRVDPGFVPDRVLTAQITLPAARYPNTASTLAFWQQLLERAREFPGVAAAGLVSTVPFGGSQSAGTYTILGRTLPPGTPPPHALNERVGGEYFRAMGIPLLEGRLFAATDRNDTQRVVIVDRLFAEKQFPGESPLGRQVNFGSPRNYTIVGVVGTVNAADLSRPVPEERIYFTATQVVPSSMTLTLKTLVDPISLAGLVRAAVHDIDPEQPVARTRTMDEWMMRSLQARRASMTLIAVFGAVALIMSAIGLYGVLSFGVAQRVREFAVRQALGAGPAAILWLVLGQGLRTVAAGIVIGAAAALAIGRGIQSLLFGVTAHDPAILTLAATLLCAVAMAACYVPARRATKVDPIAALRDT